MQRVVERVEIVEDYDGDVWIYKENGLYMKIPRHAVEAIVYDPETAKVVEVRTPFTRFMVKDGELKVEFNPVEVVGPCQ